ncbi:hypothetical protein P162_0032 [Lactococcus phage P162]|uniref:Uncharacterized protein n=1 Tax=Lactococcus phage P162 TaxID=1476889 RepID=X4YWS8_9CAUD|nr:hypothetical protein GJ24_gp32 [Lactococcus phage P162]AHV83229.1 hypothetical protein P162_0032 [Lactococcus phage P162]
MKNIFDKTQWLDTNGSDLRGAMVTCFILGSACIAIAFKQAMNSGKEYINEED